MLGGMKKKDGDGGKKRRERILYIIIGSRNFEPGN
jgi:hypothetical protein